jgi:hypothetical protein
MKLKTQIFLTSIFMIVVSTVVIVLLDAYGPKSIDISSIIGGGSSSEEETPAVKQLELFNSTYLQSQCDNVCGSDEFCDYSKTTGVIQCTSCPVGWTMLTDSLGCSDLSYCLIKPWCSSEEALNVSIVHNIIVNKTMVYVQSLNTSIDSNLIVYRDGTNSSEAVLINLFLQGKITAIKIQESSLVSVWFDDEAGLWANSFSLYTPPYYYLAYLNALKSFYCNRQWIPDSTTNACKAGIITPDQCKGTNLTTSQLALYRQVILHKRADDSTACNF